MRLSTPSYLPIQKEYKPGAGSAMAAAKAALVRPSKASSQAKRIIVDWVVRYYTLNSHQTPKRYEGVSRDLTRCSKKNELLKDNGSQKSTWGSLRALNSLMTTKTQGSNFTGWGTI